MIPILDVCKVLCHACGNYLEGVSAVFDNRVVRLCWQDFQIRAMKRGCTHEPSIGCSCWYEGVGDMHTITDRSTSESHGWSRSEGVTTSHGRSGRSSFSRSTGAGKNRAPVLGDLSSAMLIDPHGKLAKEVLNHLLAGGFIDGEGI